MSRLMYSHTDYDYKIAKDDAYKNGRVANDYRNKYLHLRKILRDYSKVNGVNFGNEINKAIGFKEASE